MTPAVGRLAVRTAAVVLSVLLTAVLTLGPLTGPVSAAPTVTPASTASADQAWNDLQTAFGTAASGTTIALTQDVTGDSGEGLAVPIGIDLTLDLAGHTLRIDAGGATVGIRVDGATTGLTIEDTSAAHTGHLIANGGPATLANGGAGIGAVGAELGSNARNITIAGGWVEAQGGYQAAGIGGANRSGGTIRITGGLVTATGRGGGAGIGGGWSGGGGTLTIDAAAYGSGNATDGGGGVGSSANGAGAPITATGAPGVWYTARNGPQTATIAVGHLLTFDSRGGSAVDDAFVPGWGPNAATVEPTAPTRDAYDFGGWTTSDGADFAFGGMLGADTTLIATWTPVRYALDYDLAGGTLGTANPAGYDVETPDFALVAPTREGYEFAGWTGTGLAAPSGAVTIPLGSTGDRAYIAAWTPRSYPVTFDSAGGSAVAAQQVSTGTTVAEPAAPTRGGYDFDGWYAGAAATSYDFATPMAAAPLALTAHWTAVPDPSPAPAPTPTSPPAPAPPLVPTAAPVPAPSRAVVPAVDPTPTSTAAVVLDPAPAPTPTPTPMSSPRAIAAPSRGTAAEPPTDSSGRAEPSAVTGSLPTVDEVVQDVARHPEHLALTAAVALVWILVLVFLVRTLGETIRRRYEVWTRAAERRHPGLARRLRWLLGLVNGAAPLPLVLSSILGAIITWFVEPAENGPTVAARLFGSILLSVLVTNLLTRVLAAVLGRGFWRVRTVAHASGWGLVTGLLGLVVSRSLQFVPGLLEASTISLRREPGADDRSLARVEALRGGLQLSTALGAWAGASATPTDGTWQVLLVHDTLVLVAVGGLFGLITDLLPLPALLGGELWHHARGGWVALTLAATTAFAVIVVPHPSNWIEVVGLGRWLLIATVAATTAVVVTLVLNVRTHREHEGREHLSEVEV